MCTRIGHACPCSPPSSAACTAPSPRLHLLFCCLLSFHVSIQPLSIFFLFGLSLTHTVSFVIKNHELKFAETLFIWIFLKIFNLSNLPIKPCHIGTLCTMLFKILLRFCTFVFKITRCLPNNFTEVDNDSNHYFPLQKSMIDFNLA